jgi:hypothetical protein
MLFVVYRRNLGEQYDFNVIVGWIWNKYYCCQIQNGWHVSGFLEPPLTRVNLSLQHMLVISTHFHLVIVYHLHEYNTMTTHLTQYNNQYINRVPLVEQELLTLPEHLRSSASSVGFVLLKL